MTSLGISLSQDKVFAGTPVVAEAYGRDYLMRRVALPWNANITYYAEPAEGGWSGNKYIPSKAGVQTVQALYAGYNAWQYLQVYDIAELQCEPADIRTAEGLSTALRFSGVATDGTQVPADNGVIIRVLPPELGAVEDGMFIARRAGSGYLECMVNNVFVYVPVTVAGNAQALGVFNTGQLPALGGPVQFSGTNNVTGWVMPETAQGRSVTGLHYNFKIGYETQAAYANFEPALALPGEPFALRMRVKGDGSGHWLRGQVTDGNGRNHNIDFARNVDFTDWRTVTAMLPNVPGPFTLNRVYMVEIAVFEEETNRIAFDRLEALYASTVSMPAPPGQRFNDPQRVTGDTGPASLTVPVSVSGYSARKQGEAAVVTLMAADGGLFATDKQQWERLLPDIDALFPDYVVVVVDMNPLRFSQFKEFELLHLALTTQTRFGTNRPVFVVSAAGEETVLTMKDGIRYIDLARGAAGLHFWVEGKDVRWGD
jgi:hypothetical protein